jgi:hypothetical protein
MQWTELSYSDYRSSLKSALVTPREIRRFGNCVVIAAQHYTRLQDTQLLLLLVERNKVTLCEYQSEQERQEDIRYLRALPP